MKKVAILAAPGFEEIELIAPLDILRRLNMEVMLAGVQSDKVVSAHDVTVTTDTMLDKLHADKLDALVLPGGAGSWILRDTPEVIHLVKKMHEAGKLVAAICAAPIVLAKAGLVKDREITAYPAQDVYRELNEAGAASSRMKTSFLTATCSRPTAPELLCSSATPSGNTWEKTSR